MSAAVAAVLAPGDIPSAGSPHREQDEESVRGKWKEKLPADNVEPLGSEGRPTGELTLPVAPAQPTPTGQGSRPSGEMPSKPEDLPGTDTHRRSGRGEIRGRPTGGESMSGREMRSLPRTTGFPTAVPPEGDS
mmetsp:Transcript_168847/g.542688  ORF Transcript_168847/g.542688 Transcript_168847/m.542688 type:complete len:133 (+) Transcript_168847:1112-1510(+)